MVVPAKKLHAYASHILATFENLETLSGTGIPMSAKHAQPIDSNQTILEAVRPHGLNGSGEPSRHGSEFRKKVITGDTLKFLTCWQARSPEESRLILAPFGFGKSGQLALFARHLALQMHHTLNTNQFNPYFPNLYIPLPVRLRSLNRDDIEKPRDGIGWFNFLVDSQRRIGSSSDKMLFTRRELAQLFKGAPDGHIICLYDGFDELANGNFGPSTVLQRMNEFHTGKPGYLLSSREPVSGFGPDNTFRLEPLSSDAVKKLLDDCLNVGSPTHRAAMERYHKLEPSITELIRRPLFLAAWVDAVHKSYRDDLSDLPNSMEGLMEQVTLECFRRARETLPELSSDAEVLRQTFPVLGWILFADAERQFDSIPRTLGERQAVIKSRLDTGLRPAGMDDACAQALAHALGFLECIGGGRYFAQKIPVVEFLIGRFLAGLLAGSDDQKRAFVQLARRWCYRPQTHDLLDFCWLAAREMKRDEVEPVVQSLIDWMCKASQHEPLRAWLAGRPIEGTVADCLVRPAARYALRTADRTEIGNLKAIAKIAVGTTLVHHHDAIAVPHAVREETWSAVVEAAIDVCAKAWGEDKSAWAKAIEAAARVRNGAAAGMAQMWIDRYSTERKDDESAGTKALSAGCATVLVQKWIDYMMIPLEPALAKAIEAARATQSGFIAVISELIDVGWSNLAIETAIHADSVALIVEFGEERGKDDEPGRKVRSKDRLIAVSRDDPRVVLDPFEAVVPEGIIARLLGTERPLDEVEANVLANLYHAWLTDRDKKYSPNECGWCTKSQMLELGNGTRVKRRNGIGGQLPKGKGPVVQVAFASLMKRQLVEKRAKYVSGQFRILHSQIRKIEDLVKPKP